MKDIGSVNYQPQHVEQPKFQPRETVDVQRRERAVERESVTTARTPVVQTSQEVQSRGEQQQVRDSHDQLLYSRPAAKIHHTYDDVSQTISYTHQASRVTTAVADESRTLLDMRA